MLKKMLIIFMIIVILIIGVIKILDYQRISNYLKKSLGTENYGYVHKVDEKITTGIGGAEEIYIYHIKDTTKVNCDSIRNYLKEKTFLSASLDKYIDSSKPLCIKEVYRKNIFSSTIIIQKDILILYLLR